MIAVTQCTSIPGEFRGCSLEREETTSAWNTSGSSSRNIWHGSSSDVEKVWHGGLEGPQKGGVMPNSGRENLKWL
ncbi:hypothetical protein J6590_045122 [Homalodisca vitripennis]|nr:hypothetical protein J6590_045122 [Homalodisca vitripennis]